MTYRAGELVRWMLPLDHDYSYGYIDGIKRSIATVTQHGGYYDGVQIEVHLKYMDKVRRGGGSLGGYKVKKRK